MVRQVALLPAGCQPWNHDVISASGNRFAYSATLAIYIYEVDQKHHEYYLQSIMSEHKTTITSICWCPEKSDYLASSSADGSVIIWDVTRQQTVIKYVHKEAVYSIGWTQDKQQCLAFIGKNGPMFLWHINSSNHMSIVKDTQNFISSITMFRWHHNKHLDVAFGHENGSVSVLQVGVKIQKHIFQPESAAESVDNSDPVTALEWDPLSKDYLLICNQLTGVRLVDVPNLKPIMCFQLPSAASQVQTLSWVKNAPGMFFTGDFKGGILRVWSVGNPLPVENIKIKATGFHRLEVISFDETYNSNNDGHKAAAENSNSLHHLQISSTINVKSSIKVTAANFTLPHVQVLCTFKDGGVGLYDIRRRKWTFLRDQGHIETIFDCKFSPENPDHLATASFDGTIKVWDITTMTCLKSSPGNEGIIYNISWAPADLNCIAACTSKKGAFIWDVNKGSIIKRFSHSMPLGMFLGDAFLHVTYFHSAEQNFACKPDKPQSPLCHSDKTSVFCVAWNHIDPKRIATSGGDGYCIIQQVDGLVIQKYKHPGPVYGCEWSPFNKDMVATGCEDKMLRIFYMTSGSDQPIKVFAGHESKVFHVRWNPLKEGILCTGSDDGNIRVWDYTRDKCICVLFGHTGRIRGLAWNSEISTFLASGSWDCMIRIWDTQDGACLSCVQDHGADVYGLTSHPSRPFLLASSSRDSTVRLWSTTSLVQPIELSILAGKYGFELTGIGEPEICSFSPQILSGQISKNLFKDLSLQSSSQLALWGRISKFFTHPCGTTNLWDLVYVIQGQDSLLSASYAKGIVHRKHLTVFKGSEAQQLEMIKMSKFGAGIGAPSKEDCLKEAAKIHIRLGNVQHYCELMVELGQWERALAVAPSVSMSYWQKLNKRYCAALAELDNEEMIPFCVAGGDVNRAVSFLSSRGQLAEAAVVAQSAAEGSISKPDTGVQELKPSEGHCVVNADLERLTVDVMNNLSTFYLRNGSPTLAACCHLAVDDQKRAMFMLIRGNELELALNIGRVLGGAPSETDVVLELLSRRCEALGKWELGLDLLKLQTTPSLQQAKLCARCSSSMAEINALHYKAGLPPVEECENKARTCLSSRENVLECVKFFLLSPACENGLNIGLQFVKDAILTPNWTADDVFPMLQLLGCIKTEKLQHSKCSSMIFELLSLSAYIGAFVAMKRQYDSIVCPLLTHARAMMQKGKVKLGISETQIEDHLTVFNAILDNRLTEEMESKYNALLIRCGEDKDWMLEPGPDCVASSHLPSHSDVQISVLSNDRIKGQAFYLEDGQSAISLNEALMWAKVNPFSPLGSGVRINPF